MEEFFGLFTTNDFGNEQPKYFTYSTLYTGDEILFTACYNIGIPYQNELCIKYKNSNNQVMDLDLNLRLCDQEIRDGSVIYILNKKENANQISLDYIHVVEQLKTKANTLLLTENNSLSVRQYSEIFSEADLNINTPAESTLVNFSISKPAVQEDEDPQDEIKVSVCNKFKPVEAEPLSLYQSYSFEKTVEVIRRYLQLPKFYEYFLVFEYQNGDLEFFNRGRQLYYYELTDKTIIHIFPQNDKINFEYPNIQKFQLQVNIEHKVSDIVSEIAESLSIDVHHDYTLGTKSEEGKIIYFMRDEPLLIQVRNYESLYFVRRYYNFSREDLSDLPTALRAMNDVKLALNDLVVWPSEDQLIDLVYYAWIVYTEGASLKDLFSDVRELFPGKYMTPKGIVQKVQKKFARATPPDRLNAVRLWLKTIRGVPGFGSKIYRGTVPIVKDGKVIWIPAKIVTTPLEILFASVEKTRRDKDAIYFAIPFIHIINAEIDYCNRISIEYTNNKFVTANLEFSVDEDQSDEVFLYISENGKIIRSILADRAKRRASGEAITFSASIDRVTLKTSDAFGKGGKEYIYDRSMTGQQLIQSAMLNLGIKDDPSKYRVMLKLSEVSYKWLESDIIIGALNLLDHMSIFILQPVRLTVIKFTNQSKKTLLIDHSQTVGDIIKFIFKKLKVKYIPGYTLYSYDKKPRVPLDARYFTFGQSAKLDKFLFRRRFFMLNDGLLETRMMRLMTIEDCRNYIMKQQTAITLDTALELAIIYRYVRAEHINDVVYYDGSNLREDIPPKFKPDEKTKKMLLEKIQNYDHLNHINACRRYMSTIRNVPGFGSESFKVKYNLNGTSSSVPNAEAILTVYPLNFALKDNRKDPKKEFVKVPWAHIRKTQSTPTTFIIYFCRKKDDKESTCLLVESPEDSSTIGNIVIGHMSMLKEINKQRKEMTRELPKEEMKRIQGQFKDEDGIILPKQIDLFIGTDPTLTTGLDRSWFNLTYNRNDVLRLCAESLGLTNCQEFDPIIYALREGYWLLDNMTLNDIKPPRKSFVFLIPKACRMNAIGPNGQKKVIHYSNTDTVAMIVEKAAKEFDIIDYNVFTLFSQVQNERPSPLMRGKSIAQQFSPKRGRFYLLRRYFAISLSNLQDPAQLNEAYEQTKDAVLKENNGAVPVDTVIALSVLSLSVTLKRAVTKEDIPIDIRSLLPKGYKNIENVTQRFRSIINTVEFTTVEKAKEEYVLIAKDIPALGAEKIAAIYMKSWSLKKDLYDENIYIVIDKKKFYAFNFDDDSPILVMEHRNIYDWVINKDYRIRAGRHWMTTIKYTNSKGEECDFIFDSTGSYFLIDTIESYREIKKKTIIESRPNRSVQINCDPKFAFQIPIRYVDGNSTTEHIDLDFRMYPNEVVKAAVSYLHLPADGQYSVMIEYSNNYRKWAKEDEMIGFNIFPVKAKLLIYNTYSNFTFANVTLETQKIILNVTETINQQIPIIAEAFNCNYWLGLVFYVKKSQETKAEPLDIGRSILEQTSDYRNVLFLRRYYSLTKYDLSIDDCAMSIYKEFKKHYLSGIPEVNPEMMVTLAYYNFVIGCKNKFEYDNTIPNSFNEYLPNGYSNDPSYLDKLIQMKIDKPYMLKHSAAQKFISEAFHKCPRFGCELFEVDFLNNLNEKHVIENDPVFLFIGYPECHLFSKEEKTTLLKFTFGDIAKIHAHSNMLFIDIISKNKVWSNCIFTTNDAEKIFNYVQNIKEFIKPELRQRTINQDKLKLWSDIKKDGGQFEVKVTNTHNIDKSILMRFSYEQNYIQIIKDIIPMFYLSNLSPDNFALVIRNKKQVIVVNESNVHQTLPAKVGDGFLIITEKNPKVIIEMSNGIIREVSISPTDTVDNVCFKLFKEIGGSYHEGYTLYLKQQDNTSIALPENEPLINYPIKTSIFQIRRRIFTISIAGLNHMPTLRMLYKECRDLFVDEKIYPEDEKAAKLAAIAFFIENIKENQPMPQFNNQSFKELVPHRLYKDSQFMTNVSKIVQKFKVVSLRKLLCKYIRICCRLPNYGKEEYVCNLKYNDNKPYEGSLKISPFGITYGGEGFFDAKGTIHYQDVVKREMDGNDIILHLEEDKLQISSKSIGNIKNYFDMAFTLLKRGSFYLDLESFVTALKINGSENEGQETNVPEENMDDRESEEEEYNSDSDGEISDDPIDFNPGIINFDHMDFSMNLVNFDTNVHNLMTTFSTVRNTMKSSISNTSSFEMISNINEMEILPMMSRKGLMLIHTANAISLLMIAICEFFDNNAYIPVEKGKLSRKLIIINALAVDSLNNDLTDNVKNIFNQFIETIKYIIALCDDEPNNEEVSSKLTLSVQLLSNAKNEIDNGISLHMNEAAALQGIIDFNSGIGLAISLIINLISLGERLNFSINMNFVQALEQGINNFQYSKELYQQHGRIIDEIQNVIKNNMSVDHLMKIIPIIDQYESLASSIAAGVGNSIRTGIIGSEISSDTSEYITMVHDLPMKLNNIIIEISKESHNIFEQYLGSKKAARDFWDSISQAEAILMTVLSNIPNISSMKSIAMTSVNISKRIFEKEFALNIFDDQFYTNCSGAAKKIVGVIKFVITALKNSDFSSYSSLYDEYVHMRVLMYQISAAHICPTPIQQLLECMNVFSEITQGTQFSEMLLKHKSEISDKNFILNRNTCSGMYIRNVIEAIINFYTEYSKQITELIHISNGTEKFDTIMLAAERITYSLDCIFLEETLPSQLENYPHVLEFHAIQGILIDLVNVISKIIFENSSIEELFNKTSTSKEKILSLFVKSIRMRDNLHRNPLLANVLEDTKDFVKYIPDLVNEFIKIFNEYGIGSEDSNRLLSLQQSLTSKIESFNQNTLEAFLIPPTTEKLKSASALLESVSNQFANDAQSGFVKSSYVLMTNIQEEIISIKKYIRRIEELKERPSLEYYSTLKDIITQINSLDIRLGSPEYIKLRKDYFNEVIKSINKLCEPEEITVPYVLSLINEFKGQIQAIHSKLQVKIYSGSKNNVLQKCFDKIEITLIIILHVDQAKYSVVDADTEKNILSNLYFELNNNLSSIQEDSPDLYSDIYNILPSLQQLVQAISNLPFFRLLSIDKNLIYSIDDETKLSEGSKLIANQLVEFVKMAQKAYELQDVISYPNTSIPMSNIIKVTSQILRDFCGENNNSVQYLKPSLEKLDTIRFQSILVLEMSRIKKLKDIFESIYGNISTMVQRMERPHIEEATLNEMNNVIQSHLPTLNKFAEHSMASIQEGLENIQSYHSIILGQKDIGIVQEYCNRIYSESAKITQLFINDCSNIEAIDASAALLAAMTKYASIEHAKISYSNMLKTINLSTADSFDFESNDYEYIYSIYIETHNYFLNYPYAIRKSLLNLKEEFISKDAVTANCTRLIIALSSSSKIESLKKLLVKNSNDVLDSISSLYSQLMYYSNMITNEKVQKEILSISDLLSLSDYNIVKNSTNLTLMFNFYKKAKLMYGNLADFLLTLKKEKHVKIIEIELCRAIGVFAVALQAMEITLANFFYASFDEFAVCVDDICSDIPEAVDHLKKMYVILNHVDRIAGIDPKNASLLIQIFNLFIESIYETLDQKISVKLDNSINLVKDNIKVIDLIYSISKVSDSNQYFYMLRSNSIVLEQLMVLFASLNHGDSKEIPPSFTAINEHVCIMALINESGKSLGINPQGADKFIDYLVAVASTLMMGNLEHLKELIDGSFKAISAIITICNSNITERKELQKSDITFKDEYEIPNTIDPTIFDDFKSTVKELNDKFTRSLKENTIKGNEQLLDVKSNRIDLFAPRVHPTSYSKITVPKVDSILTKELETIQKLFSSWCSHQESQLIEAFKQVLAENNPKVMLEGSKNPVCVTEKDITSILEDVNRLLSSFGNIETERELHCINNSKAFVGHILLSKEIRKIFEDGNNITIYQQQFTKSVEKCFGTVVGSVRNDAFMELDPVFIVFKAANYSQRLIGLISVAESLNYILARLTIDNFRLFMFINTEGGKKMLESEISQNKLMEIQANIAQMVELVRSPEILELLIDKLNLHDTLYIARVVTHLIYILAGYQKIYDTSNITGTHPKDILNSFFLKQLNITRNDPKSLSGSIGGSQIQLISSIQSNEYFIRVMVVARLIGMLAKILHITGVKQKLGTSVDANSLNRILPLVQTEIMLGTKYNDISVDEGVLRARAIMFVLATFTSSISQKDLMSKKLGLMKQPAVRLDSYITPDFVKSISGNMEAICSHCLIHPSKLANSYVCVLSRLLEMKRDLMCKVLSLSINMNFSVIPTAPSDPIRVRNLMLSIIDDMKLGYKGYLEVIKGCKDTERANIIGMQISEQCISDSVIVRANEYRYFEKAALLTINDSPSAKFNCDSIRSQVLIETLRTSIVIRLRMLQKMGLEAHKGRTVKNKEYALEEIAAAQQEVVNQILSGSSSSQSENFIVNELILEDLIRLAKETEITQVISEEQLLGYLLQLQNSNFAKVNEMDLISEVEAKQLIELETDNLQLTSLKGEILVIGSEFEKAFPNINLKANPNQELRMKLIKYIEKILSGPLHPESIKNQIRCLSQEEAVQCIQLIHNIATIPLSSGQLLLNVSVNPEFIQTNFEEKASSSIVGNRAKGMVESITTIASCTLEECKATIACESKESLGALCGMIGKRNDKRLMAQFLKHSFPMITSLVRVQKENPNASSTIDLSNLVEAIAKVSNESSMDSPKFRALVSSLVFDISRINSTFDKSTEELNTNSILMEICGALDSCSSQKILQSIAKIDSEIDKANKSGASVPTELNDLIEMFGNIRPAVARSFTSGLQLSEAELNEISKIKDFIVELAKKEMPELPVLLSNSAHNDSTVAIEAEEKRITFLISHHNEDDGSEDVKENRNMVLQVIKAVASTQAMLAKSLVNSPYLSLKTITKSIGYMLTTTRSLSELINRPKYAEIVGSGSKRSCRALLRRMSTMRMAIEDTSRKEGKQVICSTALQSVQLTTLRIISTLIGDVSAMIATRANTTIREAFLSGIEKCIFKYKSSANGLIESIPPLMALNQAQEEGNTVQALIAKYKIHGKNFLKCLENPNSLQEVIDHSLELIDLLSEVTNSVLQLKDTASMKPDLSSASELPPLVSVPSVIPAEADLKTAVGALSTSFASLVRAQEIFTNVIGAENSEVLNSLMVFHASLNCFISQAMAVSVLTTSMSQQQEIASAIAEVVSEMNGILEAVKAAFMLAGTWEYLPQSLIMMRSKYEDIMQIASAALVAQTPTEEEAEYLKAVRSLKASLDAIAQRISEVESGKIDHTMRLALRLATISQMVGLYAYNTLLRSQKHGAIPRESKPFLVSISSYIEMTSKSSLKSAEEIRMKADELLNILQRPRPPDEDSQTVITATKSLRALLAALSGKVPVSASPVAPRGIDTDVLLKRLELESRVIKSRAVLAFNERKLELISKKSDESKI